MLRENFATWHCGAHEISLARPRIMGILNVTPDSFSAKKREKTSKREASAICAYVS